MHAENRSRRDAEEKEKETASLERATGARSLVSSTHGERGGTRRVRRACAVTNSAVTHSSVSPISRTVALISVVASLTSSFASLFTSNLRNMLLEVKPSSGSTCSTYV
eukprot:4685464-Prymnesium_polylepis.1